MSIDTMSTELLNAVARHRRYGRIERLFVIGLSLIIAIGGIFAAVAIPRQAQISDNAKHIQCIVEHISPYDLALANALKFQIGTPERDAAVQRMKAEARRLHDECQ